jgi:hypothetical protein
MEASDPNGVGGAGDAADTFLEQSYLTYIIPSATHFSPEEALTQGEGEGSVEGKISSIEQREQLFFGMRFAHCARSSASHCSFEACR